MRRKHWRTRACTVIVLSLLVLGFEVKVSKADVNEEVLREEVSFPEDGVPINEKNFPDATFRKYVLLHCDDDDDGKLSKDEASDVYSFEFKNTGLTSLKGIEYFTSLTSLECSNNKLTSLDLSNLHELSRIECQNNQLKTLSVGETDISDVTINCSNNQLTQLDVSKMKQRLNSLDCSNNKLNTINLTDNNGLKQLNCANNQLKTISLKDCNNLSRLNVSNNRLSDLTCDAKYLNEVYCSNNNLTNIYISTQYLEELECSNNQLESLNLRHNRALTDIDCSNNKLKKLDIGKNLKIWNLYCASNQLTSLDIVSEQLRVLDCSNNRLSRISIDVVEWVKELNCNSNQLTNLDISEMYNLEQLNCAGNKLAELDFSKYKFKSLRHLETHYNKFKKLELPSESFLEMLKDQVGKISKDGKYYMFENETWECFLSFDKSTKIQGIELTIPTPTPTKAPTKAPSFEDFVERLYTVALNRKSDPSGKKYWINQVVEEGKTGADCARFFLLDAPEFMERGLSIDQFVETLYKTFFNRKSDEAGKKGWVEAIKSGKKSRAEVVNDFIESTEWCNVCATYGVKAGAKYHKATKASANAKNFATRLYTCCLNRKADTAGVKYWSLALTNLEQTGCSAAKEFFTSKEFVGFKTTDAEYIKRLYKTFMGRTPSADEVKYWTGEIKKGKQTRSSILAFFGQSEEFTKICKKYGIDRGTI